MGQDNPRHRQRLYLTKKIELYTTTSTTGGRTPPEIELLNVSRFTMSVSPYLCHRDWIAEFVHPQTGEAVSVQALESPSLRRESEPSY